MGVFSRSDSPVWWLYLETTQGKERTDIRIGKTTSQRHDSQKLAEERYHQRMNDLAARLYKLPSAQPAIRFKKYAETYLIDVIAHHRGAERERELLKPLRAFFDDDLLMSLDQDRARAYMTARSLTVSARTTNREIDLLKAMIRDAVPKYLAASPLVGMKRLRPTPPKRRIMTPAEERKLLRHATVVETALLVLAVDGLVRLSDLLDIRREDRKGHWIYISDSKNNESYEVALTGRASDALDRLEASLPETAAYFFQRYRGAKTDRDRRARIRRVLMKLCRKAHVPYGKKKGGITFHWATRRTGTTRLLMRKKMPIAAVQAQGNWKRPDVPLSIYTDVTKRAQRAAILPKRSRSRRKTA